MEISRYSAPVSRTATVVLGVALTLIAAVFLISGGIGVYSLFKSPAQTDVKVLFGVLVTLGFAFCVVGIRLLTGKRRRDGGLFSPWVLRFAGVFFIGTPVILFLARHSFLSVLEGVGA